MKKVELAASVREDTGRKATRALRRAGRIPVVLYGPEMDQPLTLSVDWLALNKILHADSTSLVNLQIDGQGEVLSLLKDHQEDRVRGNTLHVDFYKVAEGHTFTTVIPIEVEGSAPGVREGGILERTVREVEIECLPRDLPEHLTIDVSEMQIGDSLHVSDLKLPPGVTVVSPEPEITLVHVGVSRAAIALEEEEAAAAEAEALPGEEPAEPEVVGAESEGESGEG